MHLRLLAVLLVLSFGVAACGGGTARAGAGHPGTCSGAGDGR